MPEDEGRKSKRYSDAQLLAALLALVVGAGTFVALLFAAERYTYRIVGLPPRGNAFGSAFIALSLGAGLFSLPGLSSALKRWQLLAIAAGLGLVDACIRLADRSVPLSDAPKLIAVAVVLTLLSSHSVLQVALKIARIFEPRKDGEPPQLARQSDSVPEVSEATDADVRLRIGEP